MKKPQTLWLFGATVVAVAAVVVLAGWLRFHREPTSRPPMVAQTDIPPAVKPASAFSALLAPARSSNMETRVQSDRQHGLTTPASELPGTVAAELLANGDPDAWRQIQRRYFNALGPAALWKLLSTPGVAETRNAKELRAQMLAPCTATLKRIELNGSENLPAETSFKNDYCKKLYAAGGAEELLAQGNALSSDPDLIERNASGFDPKDATPADRTAMNDNLKTVLSGTGDPYQAADTVNSLWAIKSDAITDNWKAIDGPITEGYGLLREQRYYLQLAVSTTSACSMIGGCGPDNPWTVQFCGTPGITCIPGMDIQQAIGYNLSPHLMQMYAQIMERLQTRLGNGG